MVHLDPVEGEPYCPACQERRSWAGDICHLCDTDLVIYGERCDQCGEEFRVGEPSYCEGRHGPCRCLSCTIDRLQEEPKVEDTEDALSVLHEVEARR